MAVQNLNSGNLAIQTTAPGNTYRDFGADVFNATNIAREDWERAEVAQNNQLVRDLYLQEQGNKFNAEEAQKNRDFQTEMRATQYQTAVEDMKKAGLNPVLAYSQGGAGTPSGATASSGGARTSSSNTGAGYRSSSAGNVISGIFNVLAGLVTHGISSATQLAVENMRNDKKIVSAYYRGYNNGKK